MFCSLSVSNSSKIQQKVCRPEPQGRIAHAPYSRRYMQARGFRFQGKTDRSHSDNPDASPLHSETLLLFNAWLEEGALRQGPERLVKDHYPWIRDWKNDMHVAWALGHIPLHTCLRVQGAGL